MWISPREYSLQVWSHGCLCQPLYSIWGLVSTAGSVTIIVIIVISTQYLVINRNLCGRLRISRMTNKCICLRNLLDLTEKSSPAIMRSTQTICTSEETHLLTCVPNLLISFISFPHSLHSLWGSSLVTVSVSRSTLVLASDSILTKFLKRYYIENTSKSVNIEPKKNLIYKHRNFK